MVQNRHDRTLLFVKYLRVKGAGALVMTRALTRIECDFEEGQCWSRRLNAWSGKTANGGAIERME